MKATKPVVLAATLLLSVGTLSGCGVFGGAGDNADSQASEQVQSDQSPDDFAKALVEEEFSEGSRAQINLGQAGSEAVKEIGAENSQVLVQSPKAVEAMRKLPVDQQKKLAEIYKRYNPLASMYDMDGMDDADVASIGIWTLAFTSMYASEKNQILNVDVGTDAFKENGDGTGVLDLSKITYSTKDGPGKKLPVVASGAPEQLTLVKKDGSWKIDGKATLESIANPGGTSSAPTGGTTSTPESSSEPTSESTSGSTAES